MIVSCERDKLNSLVQTALRAISARVTMPILSGILFSAEGGKLTVCGTDLEMSVKATGDADISESGSTVVSGRLVGDVMKSLPAGTVRIETGDKFMTIKTEVGEYRIREMMPEDYPQIPSWEGGSVLNVSPGEFVTAIQQTSRASSNDEKRPVLTGSLVEKVAGEEKIRIVSTDSYRLSWKEIPTGGSVSEWDDNIIPTKTLNEVARLAGASDSDVQIKMQDKQAMFKIDDLVITTRLIEGQFPNYKQLVPKGEKTGAKVDREEFTAVLKRALIFGHNVRLGIYADHLTITTETPEVGDSKEDVPAEVEGEEMEIGFNGNYVVDGVIGVESEKVQLRFDDPQKPALVRNEGGEEYNYILMPVRLK